MSIRMLHVGGGARGRNWLEFLTDGKRARPVACVEPDAAHAAEVKKVAPAVNVFASLEEALADSEVDAALIASPSSLHVDHAIACLEAGLGVLVEKPLAPSVQDAQRAVDAARAATRPLVVAEQFRFVPAERTVRRLVQEGRLGKVSNVVFSDRRRMPLSMHGPWVKEVEYPQLSEIAIHHFDSLLSFFGRRPLSVAARAFNPEGSDYAANACSEALLEFEQGVHVQYLGALTSNKFGYSLRIEGDGGDLWTNRKHVLLRPRGKKLFLPVRVDKGLAGDERPYPMEGMASLFEQFRASVEGGAEPETSARRNVWAVAMVEAAIRSDRERRTVDLDELHRDEQPLE